MGEVDPVPLSPRFQEDNRELVDDHPLLPGERSGRPVDVD